MIVSGTRAATKTGGGEEGIATGTVTAVTETAAATETVIGAADKDGRQRRYYEFASGLFDPKNV